jgi:hypothetical protein
MAPDQCKVIVREGLYNPFRAPIRNKQDSTDYNGASQFTTRNPTPPAQEALVMAEESRPAHGVTRGESRRGAGESSVAEQAAHGSGAFRGN